MFEKMPKESSMMKDSEKYVDPQLWHACAGGMVQMPSVNSKVYYFAQGHAEHSQTPVDFTNSPRIPALVLSRVTAVNFMADPETDEVFAKICLIPVRPNETDFGDDEGIGGMNCNGSSELQEKPVSFAKTLTQSDANNGGGFSVPRYCAETIFPRLDYSADPPVQTVLAKDVHGEIWKLRHIYRGTPRRHLLTTGWSGFVNQKKLVAGDSIVFLRTENGDLCVGIRRAKRGIGGGPDQPSGWNTPMPGAYGGFSVFVREDESKLMRGSGNMTSGANMRGKGRVRAESVIEAASLAASGQPFEVVYYPRASTPEFCVKAASVRVAMRVPWCSGMRFKMAFETEDSSRISWFMGTISSVQVADPIRWPNSPWRLLQVSWDEPDLLQNVKRVNPWLVELVSNMPAIHLSPFSPPRKKLRHPDFPLDAPTHFSNPHFSNPLRQSGTTAFCCHQHDITPSGIQGARHCRYGVSLSDHLHLNKLQSGLFHPGPTRISTGLIISNPTDHEDVSCLLTIGSSATNKLCNSKKRPQLVLFGQPILTEEEISLSNSGNSSSDGNHDKGANVSSSDGSASGTQHQNGAVENSPPRLRNRRAIEVNLETGHCKVFMESEDVGRTLDLSVFGSYEELHERLADMFGIQKSEMVSHVLYRNAAGAVKHTGDEPFSDFTKTARRLTILMDTSSDNI